MKTYTPKAKDITRQWHLVDVKDQILGRISTQIAQKLIGKHKTYFVPNLDCGDYVVVINASSIKTTGNKSLQKLYTAYSGFPGGLKSQNLKQLQASHPTRVIEFAVKNMLPKNKLRDLRLKRLKIFAGDQHPYQDKLTK